MTEAEDLNDLVRQASVMTLMAAIKFGVATDRLLTIARALLAEDSRRLEAIDLPEISTPEIHVNAWTLYLGSYQQAAEVEASPSALPGLH